MLGTENLVKCVMLAIELGNVGDKMGHTKGTARYTALLSLTDELIALGTVDFSQVVAEAKDLDATEKADLYAKIKAKFDIEDDNLEALIEEALGIIVDAASLVERSVTLVKSFKKD